MGDQKPHKTIDAMLAALAGRDIPGGCDSCEAYQTVRADPKLPGVHHLVVHHDDDCPVLAAHEGSP